MKSLVVKRSIVLNGHKTSVSLEDAFWIALKKIAVIKDANLSLIVSELDQSRKCGNLSSAIRLYVLDYMIRASDDDRQKFLAAVATLRPLKDVAA